MITREQKIELALRMARSWMHCVEPRLLDTANFRRDMDALDAALSAPSKEVHPDDKAVDRFADAMKVKLAQKRKEGRGGWWDEAYCNNPELSAMLHEHVGKGDPLDVGNLAMMLHQRGERIAPAPKTEAATCRHPLEAYANSYAQMARNGDGTVDCRSVEIDIRQNMIPATSPVPTLTDEAVERAQDSLLDALRENSWDLKCFDMPTGQGDADIGWRIVGHWMAEPRERIVAEVYKDDPAAAIRAALLAAFPSKGEGE